MMMVETVVEETPQGKQVSCRTVPATFCACGNLMPLKTGPGRKRRYCDKCRKTRLRASQDRHEAQKAKQIQEAAALEAQKKAEGPKVLIKYRIRISKADAFYGRVVAGLIDEWTQLWVPAGKKWPLAVKDDVDRRLPSTWYATWVCDAEDALVSALLLKRRRAIYEIKVMVDIERDAA